MDKCIRDTSSVNCKHNKVSSLGAGLVNLAQGSTGLSTASSSQVPKLGAWVHTTADLSLLYEDDPR